jgi:hypothetical protein
MKLVAWSVNLEGDKVEPQDDWNIEVANFDEATAVIASELVNTASDEFLSAALRQWFTAGKVENLHEGGEVFWNVELAGVAE